MDALQCLIRTKMKRNSRHLGPLKRTPNPWFSVASGSESPLFPFERQPFPPNLVVLKLESMSKETIEPKQFIKSNIRGRYKFIYMCCMFECPYYMCLLCTDTVCMYRAYLTDWQSLSAKKRGKNRDTLGFQLTPVQMIWGYIGTLQQ